MAVFLKNIFIGLLIGFGAILPGVSSGVFCVIFGIYDKLLNACSSIFKNFKKNFLYLLPFAIGGFIGIFLFGNLIKIAFFRYENICKFLFIGLILGSLPALFTSIKNDSSSKNHSFIVFNPRKSLFKVILPMLISFALGLSMIFIENKLDFALVSDKIANNVYYLIFCGFIMSAGIVIPGVSNTLILMCLGIYSQYIIAISNLNIAFILPLGIGILLGSLFFIKLIDFLLKNYHTSTFSSIIGFTLGSIFVLLPAFELSLSFFIGLILIVLGFTISYKLSKI